MAEVRKAINSISEPRSSAARSNDALKGSPILSQLKDISRLPDMDFRADSGYKSRTLTIVSDLAQNTDRLPFWLQCPGESKCPSWESFKNDKKYKLWAKRVIPDFGANLEIKLLYLNNNFDRNLDKGILEFWMGFFDDAGIINVDFEIESDA